MPIAENTSLSLDTYMKRHLIQIATLRFVLFFFLFLFITLSLEKVQDFMHWKSAGSLRNGSRI